MGCHESNKRWLTKGHVLGPFQQRIRPPSLTSHLRKQRLCFSLPKVSLRHPGGDGRLRVTVQHAPAWSRDNPAPGEGPPDALDLLRVTVRREALRPFAPSAQAELRDLQAAEAAAADAEAAAAAALGDSPTAAGGSAARGSAAPPLPAPRFWRGVPPYKWAQEDDGLVWEGATTVWDPSRGGIAGGGGAEAQPRTLSFGAAGDVWHERFSGDGPNIWYLRLSAGGILLQVHSLIAVGRSGCYHIFVWKGLRGVFRLC